MKTLIILLLMTIPAYAKSSCQKLKEAITIFDINASIQDSDVKHWNKIIRASKKVCK